MFRAIEQNQGIAEESVLLPVATVLEDVASKPISSKPLATISPSSAKTIQDLFPEQAYEEKNIQKAKDVLGALASNFTNEELRDLTAQVEYLAGTWLDDFERDIFNGKTLNEVLHERGGI